jgi:hypothetical protein
MDKPILAAINIGLLFIEKLFHVMIYQEWQTGVSNPGSESIAQ